MKRSWKNIFLVIIGILLIYIIIITIDFAKYNISNIKEVEILQNSDDSYVYSDTNTIRSIPNTRIYSINIPSIFYLIFSVESVSLSIVIASLIMNIFNKNNNKKILLLILCLTSIIIFTSVKLSEDVNFDLINNDF